MYDIILLLLYEIVEVHYLMLDSTESVVRSGSDFWHWLFALLYEMDHSNVQWVVSDLIMEFIYHNPLSNGLIISKKQIIKTKMDRKWYLVHYMQCIMFTIISFVRRWRVKALFVFSIKIISWIVHSSMKWWASFPFKIVELLLQQPLEDRLKLHTWQCVVYRDMKFSINACIFIIFFFIVIIVFIVPTMKWYFVSDDIHTHNFFLFTKFSRERDPMKSLLYADEHLFAEMKRTVYYFYVFVMIRLIWWSIDVDILFDALNSLTDILETVDRTLNICSFFSRSTTEDWGWAII